MDIFICQLENLDNYPPTINLISNLVRKEHKITLFSVNIPERTVEKFQSMKVTVVNINTKDLYFKLITKTYNNNLIKQTIIKHCPENSILWTTTDRTAATIRSILHRYRHIMQLMELIEDYPLSNRFTFIKANLAKYAQKACCVVVPEYNRAHIQKTWWNLERVPFVLPNKTEQHPRKKYLPLDDDIFDSTREKIKRMSGKKIILYQGVFGKDRKLDVIAKAVKMLGTDYCLVLMGSTMKW